MDNKKGIILDNPLERYMETDRSYYKNYGYIFRYDFSSQKRYFDNYNKVRVNYSDKNKDKQSFEFGDIISVYGMDYNLIYLYNYNRFNYVCIDKEDGFLEIFRINSNEIKNKVDFLSDDEKEIILFNLEYMLDNNIGIPKNTKSSLIKLLRK